MGNEWFEISLSNFCQINPSLSLKKGTIAKKISMDNLTPFAREPSGYTIESYSGGAKFENGDTIVARITPCLENGKTAYINILDDGEVAYGSTEYIVLRSRPNISDSRFIYYLAIAPIFRDIAIQSMTGSSGRQRVQTDVIADHKYLFPPLPTQKAIAHILGTLDDKIELLRSMNETLEAMARSLFKSWFIDFDPVRKKAEGQPTGLPPEIDALFPDSFEDSELGEIPKGWRVGTIGTFSTTVNEQIFPEEMDGTEIYVGLEHIPRKSITLTEWDKSEDVQSNKSKFKQEDVLFGKLRPYFHKVVFAPVDGLCSTDILVIRSRSKEAKTFILMHLSSVEVIEYATGFSNGTKMPRTNWKDLSNFKIVSPPLKLLSEYETIVAEKISQLKFNTTESSVLMSIRDSLLPRLISGDLELTDDMITKILESAP